MVPLAALAWSTPLFWAIMIGWILSVTLHEFAHGLVAYLGGDYTIRERGLLTLNPMKYAHPVMTFVLPVLFMAMGAVPLVGAATYVNVSLLRNKGWRTATALTNRRYKSRRPSSPPTPGTAPRWPASPPVIVRAPLRCRSGC